MTDEIKRAIEDLGQALVEQFGADGPVIIIVSARSIRFLVGEDKMARNIETCKFCRREFMPILFNGKMEFPSIGHNDPDDPKAPCRGAGRPLEYAALNFIPPEPPAETATVKLDPKLANSKLPNFYEKED